MTCNGSGVTTIRCRDPARSMFATSTMARLSLFVALLLACSIPCESRASLRGQLRLLSRNAGNPPCNCANCYGQRKITDRPTSGMKGMQCKPTAKGFEIRYCSQQGDTSTWVVQSAPQLTYERFCYFTCKPVIPKAIDPNIGCTQLSAAEAKLGQSPSGNGRAFIWHSNPITDSNTFSHLDFSNVGVPDPVKNLEKAVFQVRSGQELAKMEAARKAAEAAAKNPPPKAGKPGFCVCRCPSPPTTTGPLPPYNPFNVPPPQPGAPPQAPGLPPPPPPPPAPTLQPTPPPPPTTTFNMTAMYEWYDKQTTTAPYVPFPQPFPKRFKAEVPKAPVGPFAPTFPPTTTGPYSSFYNGGMWGPGPAPGPAPAPFGMMSTTFRPYMLLDVNTPEVETPPPIVTDLSMMAPMGSSMMQMPYATLPPMGLAATAMPEAMQLADVQAPAMPEAMPVSALQATAMPYAPSQAMQLPVTAMPDWAV